MIVKLGMKSVPGKISSIKFPIPPNAPFQPPNVKKKIRPEIGAQKKSVNSPIKGTAYDAYPIKSITIQNKREGLRLNISTF
jgi:hypothetical protein